MLKTLYEYVQQHDNDYSQLEEDYLRQTGGELVSDPNTSVQRPIADLRLTASVIIPAYNAAHTILQCLYAIEQSSFNRRYPHQLEVVAVDDGSSDGTWDVLNRLSFGVTLKLVRQANAGRSQARNTALAIATGDVIICCDADIVMAPFALEELMKRHQLLDPVLLLGFYTYLHTSQPQANQALLPRHYGRVPAPFQDDRRFQAQENVWPASLCRETQHLKRLGKGKVLYTPYDTQMGVPQMLYGPIFSLRRRDFLLMGGFEEHIQGWGGEIILTAARAIALGNYVIPVYSAAGFHIYQHPDEVHSTWRNNPEQARTRQEYARNFQLYQHVLQMPFTPAEPSWLSTALARVQDRRDCPPLASRVPSPDHDYALAYQMVLADPMSRMRYFLGLGHYQRALETLEDMPGTKDEQEVRDRLLLRAEVLLRLRKAPEAVACLQGSLNTLPPPYEDVHAALVFALAAASRFREAQQHLQEAQQSETTHTAIQYLLRRSFEQHRDRARQVARQGAYDLALRDYEAALILKPTHFSTQVERARLLRTIGDEEASSAARAAYYLSSHPVITASPERVETLACAWEALFAHQMGVARVAMERLLRACSPSLALTEHLEDIHEHAQQEQWRYAHHVVLAPARDIPGSFTDAELGLLQAVIMQVLASRRACHPINIVELGSFCGQATVVLGRAIQGGHARARIVSVSEASGKVISNHYFSSVLPQEMLEWQLHKHGIAGQVTHTAPEPAICASELLLISEPDDDFHVCRQASAFLQQLRREGWLLVHQYTDKLPALQSMVHELLRQGTYRVYAHIDNLIVLRREL